jgi:hypothetical protein
MAVRRARLMNWEQTKIKGHWNGGKDRFYQLPEPAEETALAEIAKLPDLMALGYEVKALR